MKIAVMGYSGAGKSTLSKALSERTGAPLQYLDRVQFTPGWVARDRAEALALSAAFLNKESWVIDGNYTGFYQERRVREADLIVYLDFPRRTCVRQALLRYLQNRRKVRESAADGCIEKFDLEFLLWLLRDGRTPDKRAFYAKLIADHRDKAVVLRNRREVDAFLRAFRPDAEKGSVSSCASPH